MNRWVAAFPILGAIAAVLVLAPNSLDDVPRALTSLGIAVAVGAISFSYVWIRSRPMRGRAAALRASATVWADPDSRELAAFVAGVDGPRADEFALVSGLDGIQLWSTVNSMDVELPWSAIRSVDVDPGSSAHRRPAAVLVYTELSPRIAIRLVPRSRFRVSRVTVAGVGEIVARIRRVQALRESPTHALVADITRRIRDVHPSVASSIEVLPDALGTQVSFSPRRNPRDVATVIVVATGAVFVFFGKERREDVGVGSAQSGADAAVSLVLEHAAGSPHRAAWTLTAAT